MRVCSAGNKYTYPVGVDCDILQDQLVLGSCIVGYDLRPHSISVEHRSVCQMCTTEKTIQSNNSSVNTYALRSRRVKVPG